METGLLIPKLFFLFQHHYKSLLLVVSIWTWSPKSLPFHISLSLFNQLRYLFYVVFPVLSKVIAVSDELLEESICILHNSPHSYLHAYLISKTALPFPPRKGLWLCTIHILQHWAQSTACNVQKSISPGVGGPALDPCLCAPRNTLPFLRALSYVMG